MAMAMADLLYLPSLTSCASHRARPAPATTLIASLRISGVMELYGFLLCFLATGAPTSCLDLESTLTSPISSEKLALGVKPLVSFPFSTDGCFSERRTEVQRISFPSCVSHTQSLGRGIGNGRGKTTSNAVPVSTRSSVVETEVWNQQARDARLQHLEAQAIETLQRTVESFERPAFPCALIAGDVVILDLLHRVGALSDEKVKIIFIDTFHLFPETHQFLSELENRYGFKAHAFHAAGVDSKEDYNAKFGSDLFLTDIEEYDRICKVEPFSRALKTLEVDAMINGRRRDHGAERAHLEVFEGGEMAKVQPLAYWEFRDCWDYLKKYSLPYHPLHDQGFPSIGDVQTTLPVPREKWFEYAGERSGRFQGLKNPDGSEKTECGIHVESKI